MATAKSVVFQTSTDQLDALLLEVCEELQLKKTRYDLAVERYGTINRLLEDTGSPFQFLLPRIFPQGSMALGTTCKPVDGPHDLDFVLQITVPHWRWHPLAGMEALYKFLRSSETYRGMTSLKNRVVRLTYADEFYMDILPAYTDQSSGGTCILVPDRKKVSLCPSNPEGFIEWFRNRCLIRVRRVMEKAKPVPSQQRVEEKEPLQLAVQLLKRWRDLAFDDQCLAPVSVVLTALAGIHYGGEESVSETVSAILAGIVRSISLIRTGCALSFAIRATFWKISANGGTRILRHTAHSVLEFGNSTKTGPPSSTEAAKRTRNWNGYSASTFEGRSSSRLSVYRKREKPEAWASRLRVRLRQSGAG